MVLDDSILPICQHRVLYHEDISPFYGYMCTFQYSSVLYPSDNELMSVFRLKWPELTVRFCIPTLEASRASQRLLKKRRVVFTCSYYHAKGSRNTKDVLEDSGMFYFFDKIVTYLHSLYISFRAY